MDEADETYYAQVMLMNRNRAVFQIQDLEEADAVEKDVALARSNL